MADTEKAYRKLGLNFIEVTNEKLTEINFAPADELTEIAQNVKTILTTIKGEVFLDRTFGISGEIIDRPVNSVRAKLTAEIADAVNKFEPRAKVTDCFFKATDDGKVFISVKLRVKR